jgi:hypothetical protein
VNFQGGGVKSAEELNASILMTVEELNLKANGSGSRHRELAITTARLLSNSYEKVQWYLC